MRMDESVSKSDFPAKPTFERVEDERCHRQQQLVAAFRLLARYGFDEGLAGQITIRDPEFSDHFWINPLEIYFGHIRVSDLLLINHKGEVVKGNRPVNTAAFAIHSQIHQCRTDVNAVAHAHLLYGKTWSTLRSLLDPHIQDACAFYEDHALFDDYTGVVLNIEEGKFIATTLEKKKVVILRNHGLLTVGNSVDEAVRWFITMALFKTGKKSCPVTNPQSPVPQLSQPKWIANELN